MKTMDGNTAAAYVSYLFTDVAAIYPITPSSPIAEVIDVWSAAGKKNLFGQEVNVVELQSEAGAAGAVHGSLAAGALTSTYTASQGLLLMLPVMYKIAGELLPTVFQVTARAIAGHALSIFGDHSDVMACRGTGFAMLASASVQEVMDLGSVAQLATIKSSIPFIHFFDGFRTSHEIQKIELMDEDFLKAQLDMEAVKAFRSRGLNPEKPYIKGTNQNPDIFFQQREGINLQYEELIDTVVDYMDAISKETGREYKPFNYYGAEDAENVVVAMGSVCDALIEMVDYLMADGQKVGLINVHLYRPFSPKHFFDVLPKTVKKISVLDRVKEPGALGEPLYEDIKTMFYDAEFYPIIVGGRYGLGSKDVTPAQLLAVYKNLELENPKNHFTVGIVDDVSNTSLEVGEPITTAPEGTIACKFWGYGSDGTVGANKDAIKIIGDNTDMYAQAYFSYDSKKSGGVTLSSLRFGHQPIHSSYQIDRADYIACHKASYVHTYDVLEGLKPGGVFLLACDWSAEDLESHLPASMKRYIANNDIRFYTIDAAGAAHEIGLGNRTNMVTQAAFFKLAEVIPYEEAVKYLKDAIEKTYGRKGAEVVNMNHKAVDAATEILRKVEVPEAWKTAEDVESSESKCKHEESDFIKNVFRPMIAMQGDKIPVSAFVGMEDGRFPSGTTKLEKRMPALFVPQWIPENCIQCNQCSLVCPHATIRPFLLNEEEKANAPEGVQTLKAMGKEFEGLEFRMQVSTLDCLGCGSCVNTCPAKEKALKLVPVEEAVAKERDNWVYMTHKVTNKAHLTNTTTLKGSQFKQPLLEFSGACAGCGETPYAKLLTQLFGDRMMIANTTGCSSIWGAPAPSIPYTVNEKGQGPAWQNSLFENNAEFGLGMHLADKQMKAKVADLLAVVAEGDYDAELKDAAKLWLDAKENNTLKDNNDASDAIVEILAKGYNDAILEDLDSVKDFLKVRSHWIIGGDGWAYDIGYGGLDHVVASGENVNILVLDTEVYSNTGGQASKSTPTAAIAQFAADGKKTNKKDLGLMATNYGNVYVAQIAMGANMNHAIKVFQEAEAFDGPSLVIAYSTCINHGIRGGMGISQKHMKDAVECGYWHLWRFNPALAEEGKNPFVLDSKEPDYSKFEDFIKMEVRYTSLAKILPEKADELYKLTRERSEARYEGYKRLASL